MRSLFLVIVACLLNSCGQHDAFATQDEPAFNDNDWFKAGQETLAERRAIVPDRNKAKNVILFIADGMGPTTVTAARIYDGQTRGKDGEENFLSFEKFPYAALVKTYNTNAQTPDSAGTMSAMTTGVKTKAGVIAISDAADHGDCEAGLKAEVPTLAELAEQVGMSTGIISTARITHATPAAVFAHAANRSWEADVDLSAAAVASGCVDIASQLIDFPFGDGIDVAFGGGRLNFLPTEATDPEDPDENGRRRDGRNLANEWSEKSAAHKVVYTTEGFASLSVGDRPLGLFEQSHMEYEADRANDTGGEPSLSEMTKTAISILSENENGYFLMVEAGRVDHAHHGGNAARALKDAQEFANAVGLASALTSDDDTLIIVTADHGHTLSFQGYPSKGNDILGLADLINPDEDDDGFAKAADDKPYTTLVYANGPGSVLIGDDHEDGRHSPSPEEVSDLNYRQQALIPARSETHGGQDVTLYADGPSAYLFGGVIEQNYVFHVIDDALELRARAAE